MLSGDPKLSDPDSVVSKRMASYGTLAERIFIIVTAEGKNYQLAQNVFVYPVGRGLPVLRKNSIVKKAVEIIKKENLTPADTLVTCQDPFDLGEAGITLKKKFGMKLEIQIHGDIFSPWFAKQSVLHKLRVSKAPKVLVLADKIRVVSSAIKDSLLGIVPEHKIYVLPIAIDKNTMGENKNFLPNKYPGFGLIMLIVARLEPEKNVAVAIRLLKKILTIEPRAGLVVVGDGSQRKNLESLSRKLRVREHVSFEGWKEDVTDYFASCHLYLQTSFFEGYGMAVAEAAMNGKAILSTDVGLAHDLATLSATVVVPVDNEEELFTQAKFLLNQEKRNILGIAAQKVIGSLVFSREKYLQKQGEQWKNMLQK